MSFLGQRVLATLVVMIGTSTIVFGAVRLSGDPAALFAGEDTSPETLARIRQDLGFDRPLAIQYIDYFRGLATADLGRSLRYGQPVSELIAQRLPATLGLAMSGLALATLIGVPSGVASAITRGKAWDRVSMLLSLLGQSVPPFWLGILLILVFAVHFPLFPTSGYGDVRHLILPAVTIGGYFAARISRLTRAAFLEVLGQDYLRTARSKGIAERIVLVRHAAPNAAIPILTVVSVTISTLIGGSMIVEIVFAWPGLGQLMLQGVQTRDYPLVQGVVVIVSMLVAVTSFVTDLLYLKLDPRIRAR